MNYHSQGSVKVGLIALAMAVVFAALVFASRDTISQPIAFNHKKHIDNNVPCDFCHRTYKTAYKASVPQVDVCVVCHEDVIYSTPERRKIQDYRRRKLPIPWRIVYQLPDYVFFSHRLHTQVGKVPCTRCHGDVAHKTQPFTTQPVPLKMKNCINCHEKVKRIKNPYECIDCHR